MTRTVTFPGLGLAFQLDRIAVEVFGLPVYWYGVIIATGFLLAVLVCYKLAPRFGIKSDDFIDFLFFAVPLGIIGARLYYIVFYLDQFRVDGALSFAEMLNVRKGGLAIYGGIIAGVITLIVFCKVKKLNFFACADFLVFGLLIGQIAGRWGNFVNVEAYGGPTTLPWRMGIDGYANGVWQYMEVHPTFLYESLWNLLGLLILFILYKKWRKFDGQLMWTYFLWYGFGRGIVEGLRTDSLYFFNTGLRVSQILGFASALVAAAFLAYHLLVRKHAPDELYVERVKKAAQAVEEGEAEAAAEPTAAPTLDEILDEEEQHYGDDH